MPKPSVPLGVANVLLDAADELQRGSDLRQKRDSALVELALNRVGTEDPAARAGDSPVWDTGRRRCANNVIHSAHPRPSAAPDATRSTLGRRGAPVKVDATHGSHELGTGRLCSILAERTAVAHSPGMTGPVEWRQVASADDCPQASRSIDAAGG